MTDREKLIAMLDAGSCIIWECKDGKLVMSKQSEYLIDHLIDSGVVVREKGEWMEMVDCVEDGYTGEYYEEIYYNCLNCDYATTENTPFCPNCGADMRGRENNHG